MAQTLVKGTEVWFVAQQGPIFTVRTFDQREVEFRYIGDPIQLSGQPNLEVRPILVTKDPGLRWTGGKRARMVHTLDKTNGRRWLGTLI